MSNFTSVKLIFIFLLVFCITHSVFSENNPSLNNSFVQIARLKTSHEINNSLINKLIAVNEDSTQVNRATTGKDSTQKREEVIATNNANQQSTETGDSKEKSELQKNKNYPRSYITGKKLLHLFLNDAKAERLKNDLIVYGENHVPKNFRNFYLTLIKVIFQFPVVFVFIAFILFFIINIISVILILNYTVKRKNKKARYVEQYEKIYEEVLLSYIFGEIEWDKVLTGLQKLNKRQNRKILTSVLLNFHENLKGEVEKYIPEIFYNLGLYEDSLRRANSFNSFKKAQGIKELTYLYPQGAKEIVEKYVDYSDDMVRAEAQMAYIRLNQNNPFEFLGNLTKPFTRWTQLIAFYMTRLYQLPVPSFSNYLYSNHPTIQNFSLQMITYFQQLENIPEILDMMNSKVERTRFLSYKAINDLRLYEGRVAIRKKYRKETYQNKLEIIKALKNIGTEEDFQFLEIIIKSESVSLKLEACKSMYYMNQEGREKLIKMSEEPNSDIEQYIAHITDYRN